MGDLPPIHYFIVVLVESLYIASVSIDSAQIARV